MAVPCFWKFKALPYQQTFNRTDGDRLSLKLVILYCSVGIVPQITSTLRIQCNGNNTATININFSAKCNFQPDFVS